VALPLYALAGIADERLFDAQRAVREIRAIRWIAPADPRETLASYAVRLALEIDTAQPFDLGGASFGGMVALELARHLAPRNVFLFGSCRSRHAVAQYLRVLRYIARAVPHRVWQPPRIVHPFIARWFGATSPAHVDLFTEMLRATAPEFVRWASNAVFSWSGVAELPMPINHIHGSGDRLIPLHRVNPDRVIAGAGHLLNLTHGEAVNDFIAGAAL